MNNLKSNIEGLKTWMPCPNVDTECPGLAYICPLDELIVAKKTDALHDVIGKDGTSYTIFNNLGQKVFLAVQKTHFRKFDLKIFNCYGNEVIHVKRPFRLCVNKVLVWAPPDNYVGTVEQKGCRNFQVRNRCGDVVLKIKSRDVFNFVYDILSLDEEVGVVMKCNMVLNVKSFRASFPVHLSVDDKAIILGAAFLIGCLKY